MSDIHPRNGTRLLATPFPTPYCRFVTNVAAAMLVTRTNLYPFATKNETLLYGKLFCISTNMTALIWVVFENQELLVIIIHVMVRSVTEPWGGALRDDTKKEPSTGHAFLPFSLGFTPIRNREKIP